METMNNKKRNLRLDRIGTLLCVIVFIIAALGFGTYKVFDYFEQRQIAQLQAVQCPDTIEKGTFKAIKKKALSGKEDYIQILENIDAYSQDILEFLELSEERIDFVLQYPQRKQYEDPPSKLEESLKEFPYLCQWDLRWGYTTYGEAYFYQTGCAPTCLSMIFSFLLQDASITPVKLAEYAMEENLYVNGVGTDWSLLEKAAEKYGVKVSRISFSQLEQELVNGHPVICSMMPGDFTQVGHFIVATDVQDGKVTVQDPNSPSRSQKQWDINTIISQCQGMWAYSME